MTWHPAIANLRSNQRQLDADGCEVGVSRQALDEVLAMIDALNVASPADLLSRLDLSGEAAESRLVVMAQSSANYHHWTKAVGHFTAAEVRAALKKATA
jgi:hypothetical protein